jgi:hypothetical protein
MSAREIKCACKSLDAFRCWEIRYGFDADADMADIEMDGGPCQCACHDADEDDDYWTPSPLREQTP